MLVGSGPLKLEQILVQSRLKRLLVDLCLFACGMSLQRMHQGVIREIEKEQAEIDCDVCKHGETRFREAPASASDASRA